MQSIFENDIKERKTVLEKYNKISNILGIFKIIVLVFICYGGYRLYKNKFTLDLISLLVVEIIIFLSANFYHKKIFAKIHLQQGLIFIDEKNIKRINGEWRNFEDVGEEFIDNTHPYAVDLDIVGKKSIFQMLNSTNTYYGRESFARNLLKPLYNKNEIEKRQKAIKELSENYSFISYIEYLFSGVGVDKSFPFLIKELQEKKIFITNKYAQLTLKLIRIPTCILFVFSILFGNLYVFFISFILLALQALLCLIGFNKARSYVGIMRKLPNKLLRYDKVIKKIIETDFESSQLNEIKDILKNAQIPLKKLYSISNSISHSKNGLAYFILNVFFLWDYNNAINLDYWKRNYSESVNTWFAALGELESLLSFSNLPRVCSNVSIPKFSERKNYIQAIDLGHPLINNNKRVCNNFIIDSNIYIISGSNMSGKTTFMRTVGLNMILAQAGSYACAQSMLFSNTEVVTSMRIVDDLNEGISTFYAELKRIKMIIDEAHSDKSILFLIDEIFRGTNSVDRLKGAEGVLKELSKLKASGMITTHDLEVCRLEDSNTSIINCSFCENYIDNEIFFDYKLKQGKSQTTNAEYLLKKVGIIS